MTDVAADEGYEREHSRLLREATAQTGRLRELLKIAVEEYEVTEGRIISNSNHL